MTRQETGSVATAVAPTGKSRPELLYLELLKNCLTRALFPEKYCPVVESAGGSIKRWPFRRFKAFLAQRDALICRLVEVRPEHRLEGKDWPLEADTMIGLKRLDNVQACVTDILCRDVPGDLIETGVWRGGTTIFMRAILKAYGDNNRMVWVADSFAGLPLPDTDRFPADVGDQHHTYKELAISIEQVRANFERYGLLDDQVSFLKGWFRDTLPRAPIERLAVARLDGDMYESTLDALVNLYPKLSVGGYLIVDDYHLSGCRQAVDDYRRQLAIKDEIIPIDWSGVFWQRSS